jgi:hypothetical protein
MFISLGALAVFTGVVVYKFWDVKDETIHKTRTYFPAML